MTRILFAEDDENLGFLTKDGLEAGGFSVDWHKDGESAWKAFEGHDICLIDIMMPKMNGFKLAERIREKNEFVPILFLTAKSQEEDRLRGFEIGGDDYVSKPFSMKELIFRLQVFLKRSISDSSEESVVRFGASNFDLQNLELWVAGENRLLTQREGELLQMLLENQDQLVKREDILIKIWGENDYFMGRSLDVFISRLRKYLKADSGLEIKNHHGVGFVLATKK